MPRFYFDLVGDVTVRDRKGVELPSMEVARDYAKTFARELMQERKDLLGKASPEWLLQVCDGQFQRLFELPFGILVATDELSAEPVVIEPIPIRG